MASVKVACVPAGEPFDVAEACEIIADGIPPLLLQ
jgi:hypothetical protein